MYNLTYRTMFTRLKYERIIESYYTGVKFNCMAATQGATSRYKGSCEWSTFPSSLRGG